MPPTSAHEASLRREKLYTGLILVLVILAFCAVFKPIRLVRESQFADCYFNYRYDKPIGPGDRAKEQIRGDLEKRLLEKDLAPDSHITFPTTTEIKIRVPLQSKTEAAEVDSKLQELLGEVVPKSYGKIAGSTVDTSNFGDDPIATFAGLGLYQPKLHLKLGLDLQGGVHLVLKARTQNVEFEYRLADNASDLVAALDAADAAAAEAIPAEAAPAEAAKPAADAAPAEAVKPPAEATPAETTETAPDGGRPVRMAQADPETDEAPAGDDETVTEDELTPAQEVETSPEEAKLLSDEQLRERVVDRMNKFTTRLRSAYGPRIGEVYGEVVSSNIAVFRTFVDAGDADAASSRDGHAKILLSELHKIFPGAKPKFDKPLELEIPKDAMRQVKDVITRRIDRLGVSESEVRTQGTDRVVVELPGIKDPDLAVKLIGTTARLEFRKVPSRYRPETSTVGTKEETNFVLRSNNEPVPTTLVYYEAPEFEGNRNIMVGSDLKANSATVSFDQQGQPAVNLSLKTDASRRFDRFAQENFKEFLAIYLDRQVISAPEMRARHFGGQIQISGGYETVQEATNLKILLNAGALPVPVDVVEQRTVSATLGADSVRQSSRAGAFGLLLILVTMALLYRVPGILANLALVCYMLFMLACLVSVDATLTLPGILGIILSVGMAVDANVIVFERLKEELRMSGNRSIPSCITQSYERAYAAIVDGNITTLLIAAVLFVMGTGPIRGFAVTLSIGIVCSMFTALIVTRRFQNLFAASQTGANRKLYRC